MKRLYFIRHGESELNAAGLYGGTTETPLTADGRKQAEKAGEKAKNLHINHIISSPLSRAHDTAKIVAKAIHYPVEKIEINSLLIERHFGSMEGQPWDPDFNMDGIIDAETTNSLHNRAVLIWEYLQTLPFENILVVSHGSTGRMLRHVIHPDIPFGRPHPGHRLPNAEIVELFP